MNRKDGSYTLGFVSMCQPCPHREVYLQLNATLQTQLRLPGCDALDMIFVASAVRLSLRLERPIHHVSRHSLELS
jgi:hypothetical protein